MFFFRAVKASFSPSGMNKNGSMSTPSTQNSWTQITSWTADTGSYPGSTVSSNSLLVQGAKTATVSTSIAWVYGAAGAGSNSIAVRLKKNGSVIATGTTSTSSPATTSASVAVSGGDLITVEMEDTTPYASTGAGTVTSGATSYVRCI